MTNLVLDNVLYEHFEREVVLGSIIISLLPYMVYIFSFPSKFKYYNFTDLCTITNELFILKCIAVSVGT